MYWRCVSTATGICGQEYSFTPYQYLQQQADVLIYTDSNAAVVIPLSAFDNQEQAGELQILLQQKIRQSQGG
ncbi:hypothetical protein A1D23_02325 [Chelonobacter oris]|uniref:hypothetical protein n=1 Tax=Chelonobacter oris TaxID=505317 RepID=UPI002448DC86|nr:hypothetical protein [Chelonobacter oris]MDH3001239.1 hypothetical protein [Chelonobacter oris]